MMCEVDDILRNLKAIFAAGDLFAAEKATETWQKYESINTEGNCFRNILQKLS